MVKNFLFYFILFSSFFCACDHLSIESTNLEKADVKNEILKLNFNVSLDNAFENTIYPSYLLALIPSTARDNKSLKLLRYNFTSIEENSNLKIILEESILNKETTFTKELTQKGEKHSIYPIIRWDYEKLKTIKQQGSVDLFFRCFIDDKEVGSKNLRLNYRSRNECVNYIDDKNFHFNDLSMMFGAYVNEDHPKVDKVLQNALQYNIVSSFDGYSSGADEIQNTLNQVFSIWYYLQTKGVKYSSITKTSNTNIKVYSQHIRLFDEVYENNQANCVDGSVFLCSILRKIGLKPVLIFVPGHLYMGFYTKRDKSSLEFLETTLVGKIDFKEIEKNPNEVLKHYIKRKYLKKKSYTNFIKGKMTLEEIKKEISYSNFTRAIRINKKEGIDNIINFGNRYDTDYQIIEVEKVRYRISAIPS